MKKPKKNAGAKKTTAPAKTRVLFINPDGTVSTSYASAISWDRDKPNSN